MASYEVLVDELTLHRSVGDITDPLTGEKVGVQNGRGETYYKGEKVDEADITPDVLAALEDKDHPSHEAVSKRLKKGSGDAEKNNLGARLGAPFAGYDDMEEDDIVAAMRVLPSAAQQRIKDYEAERDDPRERIMHWNIGFGESPIERQEGAVSGDLNEDDDRDVESKASARIKTRTVPEEGPVEPGEGITGTGDPEIAYGTEKDEEGGDMKGTGRGRKRGGRQARQPKPTGGTAKDSGGGSLERSNE